jgi:hypothetical protein
VELEVTASLVLFSGFPCSVELRKMSLRAAAINNDEMECATP